MMTGEPLHNQWRVCIRTNQKGRPSEAALVFRTVVSCLNSLQPLLADKLGMPFFEIHIV